jgi:hypothetical protein
MIPERTFDLVDFTPGEVFSLVNVQLNALVKFYANLHSSENRHISKNS